MVVQNSTEEEALNSQIQSLAASLSNVQESNKTLTAQNSKLTEQNSDLLETVNSISQWTERAPIITMMEPVSFSQGMRWKAPASVSTGSIIKLIGFDCNLVIRISGNAPRRTNPSRGSNEFPVSGAAGARKSLSISREPSNPFVSDQSNCSGKVQVAETLRTSSTGNSYEK